MLAVVAVKLEDKEAERHGVGGADPPPWQTLWQDEPVESSPKLNWAASV
jgi:hypothetical protein